MSPPLVPPPADVIPGFFRRLLHGFKKVRQLPEWESFVGPDWGDRIMSESILDRRHAKQGREIGRWTLSNADGRKLVVYVKRHHRLPRRHGLLAALFPRSAWSAGLQEWDHLAWATEQGIPVPRAIAAGELVDPWGRIRSFLAVEELTGMLALHEAIPLAQANLDAITFQRWKRSLATELARLAWVLHRQSVYHKDLYLCHFFIAETDCNRLPEQWCDRVFMIDFHRMGRHWFLRERRRVKDLAQLLYSSEIAGVTPRDRVAFWRAYRKAAGIHGRFTAKWIRWKWRLYRRHNARQG